MAQTLRQFFAANTPGPTFPNTRGPTPYKPPVVVRRAPTIAQPSAAAAPSRSNTMMILLAMLVGSEIGRTP